MNIMQMIGEDTEENNRRLREKEKMQRRITGMDPLMRIMAIDLGAAVDHTAITILERAGDMNMIRHIERLPLGMDYMSQVDRFQMLTRYSHIDRIVVDKTGIGAPVVSILRNKGIKPISITITSGNESTFKGSEWHVTKRDLISCLLVSFQNGFVKIADVPERKTLIEELQNFEVKISKGGHDSYAAAGTGHDDLVLSASMAVYSADRLYRRAPVNMEDAQGFGGIRKEKEPLCHQELHNAAMLELRRRQNMNKRR